MKIVLISITVVGIISWLIYRSSFIKQLKKYKRGKTVADTIGGKLNALNTAIGETERVCPHCHELLDTEPSLKAQCPHCGRIVYKRKRPYDKKDILVTRDQLEEVEEQWAIVSGEHEKYQREKKRKKKIAKRIKKQTGENPPTEKVELEALIERAEELEKNGDWGLARNKKVEIAEFLEENSRNKEAIRVYIEVCYLDANGPRNVGNLSTEEEKRERAFSQDLAFISPGIIKKIARLMRKLDLKPNELKQSYLEIANDTEQRLIDVTLPRKPRKAWLEFRAMLN